MLNDRSTPATLLATRRSGKPRDMVAPGPDAATLDAMLAIAARTPDHGKLAPWRFVVVEDRDRLAALLTQAYRAEKPGVTEAELANVEQFARQAPTLVVVLSSPRLDSGIPRFEQELSAGAACMNLLHAAAAHGFVGGWLTGWAAQSDAVLAGFGTPPERIVGFVFVGTPSRAPEERPRPDLERVVSRWRLDTVEA
ncbi:nitroreductase family protein [Sphingomonas rubra]|uniref:Putative NAD(P)H nitroreductase n=1 Tax=Sphingomonas rubra TaxID=634430 RepID=A0A1I5SH59_9SPHN|nr:nitroreductase [Sphingomonas rubra]SFP70041.1 Nitroreductase [Sphingomonas rubra]